MTEQNTDADSHANTCIVSGDTALIIHDFEIPVTVHGHSEKVGRKTCQTVTGVVAHTTHDGTTWHFHIHQALEIPGIKNNLLCPMQLQDNGLRFNDEPKHMVPNPTKYHHAVTIPATSEHDEIIIPLSM